MVKSVIQAQAESRLRPAIEAVEKLMPPGMGIAILVFERNTDKGNMGYIANARREDMRRALTEFLGKWEADAGGKPFYPLTLEAFEAWATDQALPVEDADREVILHALSAYKKFSNASPTNPTEVTQQ